MSMRTQLLRIHGSVNVLAGNHLEGKTTAVPLRKPHGAAVFPLHEMLASGLNGDQEEKDIQMDVYVYVLEIYCTANIMYGATDEPMHYIVH